MKLSRSLMRGLVTALSLLILVSSVTVPCLADTSNDLRESLGLPENSESYDPNGYTGSNQQGSTPDTDQEMEEKQIEVYTNNTDSKAEQYNREIEQLEARLKTRIESNSTAYMIIVTVDNLLANKELLSNVSVNKAEYSTDYVENIVIKRDDNEIIDDTTDYSSIIPANELPTINSIEFDIGNIGDSAIGVVEKYFKLVLPWGYNKWYTDEEYSDKLLGIELYAREGDNILSQWNGYIVASGVEADGLHYVKVYHGNYTYTVYRHTKLADNLLVGNRVLQGDVIGTAENTVVTEQNKDNHILYQVMLNGKYVNPLLVYGNRGQKIYEQWLTSSAYENVVEVGEKYYNDADESYTVENDDTVLDVLYPDFNKEQ